MKIDIFDYPTVVWRPLSREPLRISAQTLCRQKLDSMACIFAADSMGLSSFNFCGGLRNIHLFWSRMRIGRSRSSKVVDFGTNRKGLCDFLLVINSNFGPISHRFWDTAIELLAENCEFSLPYPCLTPPFRGNPSEFLDETYRAKARGMELLYVENRMILTSTVFAWITRVTHGQTDGRNCDSIMRALACCRAQKLSC